MMNYVKLSENYNNNILIPENESPYRHIKNKELPYFISMVKYNQKHYDQWKQTKSLKSINDGIVTRLWADFDSKDDLKLAFNDGYEFYLRLKDLDIPEEAIQLSFSGNKGIGILVELKQNFNIKQIKSICLNLSKDLKTFDSSMYDHQRIFRLLFTKNEKSGLFKIPITPEELKEANIENIKSNAENVEGFDVNNIISNYIKFSVNDKFLKLIEVPKEEKKLGLSKVNEIDWSAKPKNWKNCKWSLLQGEIPSSKRHESLLILASTCKALGNSKDMAYDLVKGALRRSVEKNGQGSTTKEEAFNIVEDVYDDYWQGGQYTCKEPGFLQSYCNDLGDHKCNREKEDADKIKVYEIKDLLNIFDDFVKNFDKNRIMTGIKPIDDKLNLTIGQPVAILAAPSVGKTSLLLNILSNNSQNKVHSMFFSLDMYNALITQKLLHRHTKLNFEKLKDLVQNSPKKAIEYYDQVENNMKFMHSVVQSGISVAQMKQVIQDYEREHNIKVKIVAVDYLELIGGQYSDETANSAFNARALKDLANDLQVSVIVLTQPQKTKKPDEPITSYRDLKGASLLEQSFRIIIGMYRPGFSPDNPEEDKFIGVNCVKNTMGPLFSTHLKFDGLSGNVTPLTESEWDELDELREKKKAQKEADNNGNGRF